MAIGRQALKRIFRTNTDLEAYKQLINSTINIQDDGIQMDRNEGLSLTPKGASKKLMSFYEQLGDPDSIWSLAVNQENKKGLNFIEGKNKSRLFIQSGGNVGIGTTSPGYKLEVNGVVGMDGRVGTYAYKKVDADGQWHSVLRNLDGCQGFEILAHIESGKGHRFALTHTIVLNSEGKGGARARTRKAVLSSNWFRDLFGNRIQLRWKPEKKEEGEVKYELQIRSRARYRDKQGRSMKVFFRVTKIWDKNFEYSSYDDPQASRDRSQQSIQKPAVRQQGGGGIQVRKPEVRHTPPPVREEEPERIEKPPRPGEQTERPRRPGVRNQPKSEDSPTVPKRKKINIRRNKDKK